MSEQIIIEGDCLAAMRGFADKNFDLVLTDPPYGIGADKKNAHSRIRDNDKWDDVSWDTERPSKEYFDEILRIGKKVAIWGGNYFTDYLPVSQGWIVWSKPSADTEFSMADGEICWTSEDFALRIKKFNRGGEGGGRVHPTQKPLDIFNYCIEKFTDEGDTILDPFMGSGTTLVAAKYLNRNATGIEISPKYCEIARKRLSQEMLF